MKKLLKFIYASLPWYMRERIGFYRLYGRFPNLSDPKLFNEKVLSRKRTTCLTDDMYPIFADKYLVRDYVESKIGPTYLIPLIAVFDNVNELSSNLYDFENFVLKPNHGAGMVKVVDGRLTKSQGEDVIIEAEEWMEKDYSKKTGELHYKNIQRKLLVEQKIGNKTSSLTDYKIHLFRQRNGDFFYVLQLIDDRFHGELSRTFYVNTLECAYSGKNLIKPDLKSQLQEAVELSKKLLGHMEYARIDWYIDDGKIYFGEITLTPASGLGLGYGKELDSIMGEKWDLSLIDKCPS